MRKLMLIFLVSMCIASLTQAGVVGKDGSTLPDRVDMGSSTTSGYMQADWEYSTAGTIDAVPTTGGSWDGWGEHFITMVTNNTGSDQMLVELGFPCGGTIQSAWKVWMGSTQPTAFSGEDFGGSFTAVDPDDQTLPPVNYTYVDISADGVVIPDGATFWFGYTNPGLSGQVDFNGVDTYAWYGGLWDPDQAWGRTTVMQLRANIPSQPTPTPTPTDPGGGGDGEPIPTLSTGGIAAMVLLLLGIGFAVVIRRR